MATGYPVERPTGNAKLRRDRCARLRFLAATFNFIAAAYVSFRIASKLRSATH